MKIDRRFFLSFVAGGTVGSVLSPLPWKLMDDISIWSQVWPWVPVPKYGKSTYLKSTCSLCNGNCGISVRKVGDRVVKINGLENNFIDEGGICGLGLSGPQFLYGPFRIDSPMICHGNRGSGKWKKISWENAISIIVDKLISLDSNGENSKLGCISGLQNGSVSELIKRFFYTYGSSNFVQLLSSLDMFNVALKHFCNSKNELSAFFDLENSDYILSFGSGLFDGWISPVKMMKMIKSLENNKLTLVQIESVFSNTAAKADHWVSINPGKESDLAFGIASYIIKKNYYDNNFVIKYFPKFDIWKKLFLKKYPLEIVSESTGVEIDKIIDLSESFFRSKRPIVLCGRGNGMEPVSYVEYVSIFLLNFLKGSFNRLGGINISKVGNYLNWPPINKNNTSEDSSTKDIKYTIDNFFIDLSSKKTKLDLMFVIEDNPLYTFPDTSIAKKAIDNVPFLVSFSSFMDETVLQSDLVLPSSIYLERVEEKNLSMNFNKLALGLSQSVAFEELNTRHFGDVIIEIAHSMDEKISNNFPWENYESCLKSSLEDKWDSLVNNGVWIGNELEKFNIDNFDFSKVNYESVTIDGNCDKFPLVLIPTDSTRISSSYIFTPPFLIKTIPDTVLKGKIGFVDINPQTAVNIGLKNGECADLTTPRGKARVRVNFCHGVRQGVLVMVRGLGHKAYDEYVSEKGVNINNLMCLSKDSVFGYNVAYGVRANLTRA